ncbi:DMT family transporter [Streptomyces gossypii]|uniref:DMT family transporter n=1 Tax=Streptomyces gossypii TaxID=2883101 RepID=UPI0035CD0066
MIWGVASALLANLLFSAGFVIEKRALSSLPPLSAGQPGQLVLHLLRSPLWILGAASLLLGFTAQLAVYRTLPLIAAQGLFVTGLVMLLLLSARFLGEKSSGRERQSMVAIVAALVMIVFSLRGSPEEISRLAPAPVLLLICVPSLALGLGIFFTAERRSRRRHRLPTAGVPYGVAVGFLYGVSSLAIKGVAGLLDLGDPGGTAADVLTSPYPYLLLVTGSTGLVLSQTALQRCRASLIVPVCTTVTFLYTVVSGTVAFSEPLPDEPLRLALRVGGAALAISVLLALPRHDEPTETDGPDGPTETDRAAAASGEGAPGGEGASQGKRAEQAGATAPPADPARPANPALPADPALPAAGRPISATGPTGVPEPRAGGAFRPASRPSDRPEPTADPEPTPEAGFWPVPPPETRSPSGPATRPAASPGPPREDAADEAPDAPGPGTPAESGPAAASAAGPATGPQAGTASPSPSPSPSPSSPSSSSSSTAAGTSPVTPAATPIPDTGQRPVPPPGPASELRPRPGPDRTKGRPHVSR